MQLCNSPAPTTGIEIHQEVEERIGQGEYGQIITCLSKYIFKGKG